MPILHALIFVACILLIAVLAELVEKYGGQDGHETVGDSISGGDRRDTGDPCVVHLRSIKHESKES